MSKAEKAIASLLQLLSLSAGRDKSCRIVQYFCKFLSTKFAEQYEVLIHLRPQLKQKVDKSSALMTSMSMTRKVLRFGPSIATIKTIINNLKVIASGKLQEPLIILILKTLSAFFIGVFFICDHYLWLHSLGLVSSQQLHKTLSFLSPLGWFFDCFTNLLKNIILLNSGKKKPEQRKALLIDTLRVVCDIPVAYSFVKAGSVNGKTVGLLGTLTSFIGLYQMWK